LGTLPGIDPKTANDQVETDKNKRNTPYHEKQRSALHNYHSLPNYREASPKNAEWYQEGIRNAQAHPLGRLSRPQQPLIPPQVLSNH
jgi:ABC-type oligopeptide transport system substrate-binding subunit